MRTSKLGILLIGFGVLVLLGNFGLMEGSFFLIGVGAAFIFAYLKSEKERKPYGLLIPGMLTLGLGLFSSLEPLLGILEGGAFFATMGLAFMGIHLVHMKHNGSESDTKWAVNVGLGGLAFGAFVAITELMDHPIFGSVQQYVFPIVLIGAGAYMLLGKGNSKGNNSKDF